MVLACLILYKLTKSISNIVQGLMSGSPSLGGSMMTDQVKSVGARAAQAGAAVASGGSSVAGSIAGARAAGTGTKGILTNIARQGANTAVGARVGKVLNRYDDSLKYARENTKMVDIFRDTARNKR